MSLHRIRLYPKDIQLILGKSVRQSRRIYHKIMNHYQKKKPAFVTISEFVTFYELSLEEVENRLKD